MAINLLFLEALEAIRIHSFLKVHISKLDMFQDTPKESQSLENATCNFSSTCKHCLSQPSSLKRKPF